MRHTRFFSITSVLFLACWLFVNAPAHADDATITLVANPLPPECAENPGGLVTIYWNILHSTTPDFVYYRLIDPDQQIIEEQTYPSDSGLTMTRYWTVPQGSPEGSYWVRVEYWSIEVGREARAETMFLVCLSQPEPEYPCCVEEDCMVLTEMECASLGGEWHPEWVDCGPPNPCIPYAACCWCTECQVLSEADCLAQGGVWLPNEPDCEPNPCDASPADDETWGRIKSLYR